MRITSTNRIDLTTPAKAIAYLESLDHGLTVLLPGDPDPFVDSRSIYADVVFAATGKPAAEWAAQQGRTRWTAGELATALRATAKPNPADTKPSIRHSPRGKWSGYVGHDKVRDFGLNGIEAQQWINTQRGSADPGIELSTIDEMATALVTNYRDCFATLRRLGFTSDTRRHHPLYVQATYVHGKIKLLAHLYPFLRAWTATGWAGKEGAK